MSEMWTDILLQAFLILTTLSLFLYMYNVPQTLFAKLQRSRALAGFQAKRHFVKGAQLLGKARSKSDFEMAKAAALEADKAIALDPKDAAAYLLKGLALELQGFKTSAVDSLDLALTRGLEEEERANALFKRAQLKLEVTPGGLDSVVNDLVESVGLRDDNGKAFCLLGQCYQKMGLSDKAKKAYEDALRVQPGFSSAQNGLESLLTSK